MATTCVFTPDQSTVGNGDHVTFIAAVANGGSDAVTVNEITLWNNIGPVAGSLSQPIVPTTVDGSSTKYFAVQKAYYAGSPLNNNATVTCTETCNVILSTGEYIQPSESPNICVSPTIGFIGPGTGALRYDDLNNSYMTVLATPGVF